MAAGATEPNATASAYTTTRDYDRRQIRERLTAFLYGKTLRTRTTALSGSKRDERHRFCRLRRNQRQLAIRLVHFDLRVRQALSAARRRFLRSF
jgi:hypothetical protein